MLDGVFAFVLYDTRDRTYVAARDAIGVNPLYIGWGSDGTISLAASAHFAFTSARVPDQIQTERGISRCGRQAANFRHAR
jgi:asparagine synthetase B (glutamine-hydrolysing)